MATSSAPTAFYLATSFPLLFRPPQVPKSYSSQVLGRSCHFIFVVHEPNYKGICSDFDGVIHEVTWLLVLHHCMDNCRYIPFLDNFDFLVGQAEKALDPSQSGFHLDCPSSLQDERSIFLNYSGFLVPNTSLSGIMGVMVGDQLLL